MPARITDPRLAQVNARLQQCEPRGRELAGVLDRYDTSVRFAGWVSGGFTLNLINTIFLDPRQPLDYLVTLLAHEACHVEQRFIVDSVEQELVSYQAQCEVAKELGVDLGQMNDFVTLSPTASADLDAARRLLVTLFAGQPAAILYASMPLLQPAGLGAGLAAVRELASLARAGLSNRA
jgi:hypothetical protein